MSLIARKSWRRRVGFVLVALYALALSTPVTAVVVAAAPSLAHCFEDIRSAAAHHDAAEHDHHDQSAPAQDSHRDGEKCCGLFGVNAAIAPGSNITSIPLRISAAIAFAPSASLFGRGFERIDRPPRVLLAI
ncbi:MAG TPA: DUF2946 family protein [Pseudolabrys sp.]|nr:DUF2946 family protein [Pseudolabrys sp.]